MFEFETRRICKLLHCRYVQSLYMYTLDGRGNCSRLSEYYEKRASFINNMNSALCHLKIQSSLKICEEIHGKYPEFHTSVYKKFPPVQNSKDIMMPNGGYLHHTVYSYLIHKDSDLKVIQ